MTPIALAEVLESEKAQLRAEIDRLQSNLTASASAFAALEAVAAEARRNDAIAMSWISEAKHAIGYVGDMPGFIEALRALKEPAGPEQVAHETRFSGDSCLRMANLELAGYRKRMQEIEASMSVAEQDQINAEAAIRSIYGTPNAPLPNNPLLIAGAVRNATLIGLLDRLEAAEKEREALLEALKHIARTAIARATGEQP